MILHNLSFEEYVALPGLNASKLKRLLRSPLAYKHYLDQPEDDETKAKTQGRAAHTAILEPHKMKTDYVLWEGESRRTKEWAEFKLLHAGKTILNKEEFGHVRSMYLAVHSFLPAARYLFKGDAEVSLQWEEDKRLFKGRIDWITKIDGQTVLVDLKTTRNSSADAFGRDAFRLGYHLQFAHYRQGWHALTGEWAKVVVIAVENDAPFEPAVFGVPEEILELGLAERAALLETLDECEATNKWPPALPHEVDLVMPRWAYPAEDGDLSDLGLVGLSA